MRVFRSLEEMRAAENLEPGWRLALERVMGDLVSALADRGCSYDPDTEGPVVLVESDDKDADLRNLMGCALSEALFEGVVLEHRCFVAVWLANNSYAVTLVVPADAPWLAPESLARLIDAMG